MKVQVEKAEYNNTLLLIDGNCHMYRAYCSTIKWFKNIHYNAVWQFKRILNSFLKKYNPRTVVVAFDSPGGSFRNQLDDTYKEHRAKMPGPLRGQFSKIKKELDKMGIKWIEKQGFEADDLIGIISRKGREKFELILIATQDKDMNQLITNKIKILKYRKKKWEVWDKDKLMEETNITPRQVIPFLALMGDSVDNIKGVPGIGPKTASRLLRKYSLEEILKMSQYNKFKEQVEKNIMMVTIKTTI